MNADTATQIGQTWKKAESVEQRILGDLLLTVADILNRLADRKGRVSGLRNALDAQSERLGNLEGELNDHLTQHETEANERYILGEEYRAG
jgi:hypothetical protein